MCRIKQIPSSAGIYIFKRGGKILYIGKAANLKKRLAFYFRKNANVKVRRLVEEATKLDFMETPSEIEALIKEAELIKKHLPKYNVLLRDDKNYFYVGITQEKFPRIFLTHQPYKIQNAKIKNQRYGYIGPFTSGGALKITLKILRRVFPYCTCKIPHKRPCLNFQIGRCPGFCCDKSKLQITNYSPAKIFAKNLGGQELQNEYGLNIKNITAVLNGRSGELFATLKREMKNAVRAQNFEEAAKLRDQIRGLENIFAHRKILEAGLPERGPDFLKSQWNKIARVAETLLKIKTGISRVEGYDISNLLGKEATGSMVVFVGGKPQKSEYRKFRIKTVRQASDVDMLKEVIRRRFRHSEWQPPDLVLIDGGKAQLNAALAALEKSYFAPEAQFPKVAALAKKEEELYTENGGKPIRLSVLPPAAAFFFQRVRDEAHRFARKYHHKLREISYREK